MADGAVWTLLILSGVFVFSMGWTGIGRKTLTAEPQQNKMIPEGMEKRPFEPEKFNPEKIVMEMHQRSLRAGDAVKYIGSNNLRGKLGVVDVPYPEEGKIQVIFQGNKAACLVSEKNLELVDKYNLLQIAEKIVDKKNPQVPPPGGWGVLP